MGMKEMNLTAAMLGIVLTATLAPARTWAEPRACIELKTVAEVEKSAVDPQGAKSTVLVPAVKVPPGGEVVWTVTATNVCAKPAERVAIDNPEPST